MWVVNSDSRENVVYATFAQQCWALLSKAESRDTYMYSQILISLKSGTTHKNREEGLTISKLKKKLTVPLWLRRQNLIESRPAQKKYNV